MAQGPSARFIVNEISLSFILQSVYGMFRRSTLSLLLYVAEHCNRYFSRQDIPNMLSTFLPLVTKEARPNTPSRL